MEDAVDRVLAQWGRERPDLDVRAMAVIGRIGRAEAILDRRVGAVLAEHDLLPGEFDLLATLRRAGSPHRLAVGQMLASTMVTSAPKLAQTDANSQPMTPPPSTTTDAGTSVRARAWSLSSTRSPSGVMPGSERA